MRHPIYPSRPARVRVFAAAMTALALATAFADAAIETRKDVEYGRAGEERLLLDVRVPDGAGPLPVAILVHGGGWSGGDKGGSNHPGDGADISPWFAPLSNAGYVSFSINYRLAPRHRWPACAEDLATAIRWVKAHASEYKADAGRIVLFGHSAGGHLVTYAATSTEPAVRVQAVVGFAPVTDLEADSDRRGGLSQSLQNLFGLPKEITPDARAILREWSPINRVHAGMPPILIVHGDADRTVPLHMSVDFITRLHAAGVPCELLTRKGVPHSLVAGDGIEMSYQAPMIEWLRRTLAGAAEPKRTQGRHP